MYNDVPKIYYVRCLGSNLTGCTCTTKTISAVPWHRATSRIPAHQAVQASKTRTCARNSESRQMSVSNPMATSISIRSGVPMVALPGTAPIQHEAVPSPNNIHQGGAGLTPKSYIKSIEENPNIPASERLSALAHGHKFPDRGRVYCYEIYPEHNQIRLVHDLGLAKSWWPQSSAALEHFWNVASVGSETCLRLIVAEDISYDLINILGSACELDPLLFIQHLTGSNINRPARVNTTGYPFPGTFLDDNSHIFSARWYRPVRRVFETRGNRRQGSTLMPWDSMDVENREDKDGLLSSRLGPQDLERLANEQLKDKGTNIFRNSWHLGRPSEQTVPRKTNIPSKFR